MNQETAREQLLKAEHDNSSLTGSFCYCSYYLNCLEPLLQKMGWQGAERHIADLLPHFADTLDYDGFIDIFQRLNYEPHELTLSPDEIDTRLLPCLFIPKDNIPIVIMEKNEGKKSFRIIDGRDGSNKELTELSIKGKVIFLTKSETFTKKNKHARFNWFGHALKKYRRLLLQTFFISFILNLLSIIPSIFVMTVYDKVISSGSVPMLLNMCIGVSIGMLGIFALQEIRSRSLALIGALLDNIVGDKVFEKLILLPASYTENATIGEQVSRIKDFDSLREFFSGPLLTIIFELPFVLIFIIFLSFIGKQIVIIPLIMIFIFVGLSYVIKPIAHKYVEEAGKHGSARHEFLMETANKMRSIKHDAAEIIWKKRFDDISAEAIISNYKASLLTSMTNAFSDAFMMLTSLLTIAFGVILVIEQTISIGALIATMILVWKVLLPIKSIVSNMTRLDQIFSSIKQVNTLMNLKSERDLELVHKPTSRIKGKIDFLRVSLRYHPEMDPVLTNLTFSIQEGELVTVTGKNGSGKSSFLKLILGLYTQNVGSIRIDNKDIRQIDPSELRHSIGYLPQTNYFFHGTVAQNLRLTNPLATLDDLEKAAQFSGIYQDITQLKEGFDTRLTNKLTQNLSSCFLQRLALARTFVKTPKILLFDEPTNTLDDEGQEYLLKAIDHFKGKSTIIIVTHRPSLLKIAERSIYLNAGYIRFDGTPEALLEEVNMRQL